MKTQNALVVLGIALLSVLMLTLSLTSLDSCTTRTSTPNPQPTSSIPTITVTIGVSKDQAVSIAAQNLPYGIFPPASVESELNVVSSPEAHPIWFVLVQGFTLTYEEFIDFGWRAGQKTNFSSLAGDSYHVAIFNIDAVTGQLLNKSAASIWKPPPTQVGISPPTSTIIILPLSGT